MLNIIIVNDYSYTEGGASAIALETAKLLSMKGHKVVFFSAVYNGDKKIFNKYNIKLISTHQYDILNNPKRWKAIFQGLWNIEAAKKFKKVLDEFSPTNTIIHIHTLQKAISSSILFIARHKGFKIIYHLHDYGVICPNLGLFDYVNNSICNKKPMSINCIMTNCDARCYRHKIWRVIRALIQKKIGGLPDKIDGVIYVSKFSENILNKYIGKGIVINNPVIKYSDFMVKPEKNKYIIYIGRLSRGKNPILLAKIAKKMNIPVIFIGDGTDLEEVKKQNPNALCTGWLEKKEIDEYILKARCLVFPSEWYETQGMVVAEVMAHGVPAIVSDCSAAKDFIENNVNGLIFKNNSESDLKKALKKIENDKFVKYLGRNSYNKQYQTEDKYIELVKCYYDKILSQTK